MSLRKAKRNARRHIGYGLYAKAVLAFADGRRHEFTWTGEHTHHIPIPGGDHMRFRTEGDYDEQGRMLFREVTDGH